MTTYKRLYLAERPQHGSVVLREGGHFAYTSTAGYTGPDKFTLRICGTTNAFEGCTNILYDMTVVP
jgi:hypothetical protein